jgi:hypothetical protein
MVFSTPALAETVNSSDATKAFAGDSTPYDEKSLIPSLINDLKKEKKCHSIIIQSRNLTSIVWIENGQQVSRHNFWASDARTRFSGMIKGLDLNVKTIDVDVPTPNIYAKDPFGSAKKLEKIYSDLIDDARKDGQFNCEKSAKK